MRICRVDHRGEGRWGIIEGDDSITLLSAAPFSGLKQTSERLSLDGVRLLAPATPSKIVCVGINYRSHAVEMKKEPPVEPRIFLKAPSSLNDPAGLVVLPDESQQIEHEGELAVVIGRMTTRVSVRDALDAVLGYTCLDDVTARDIQLRENLYARAKGYDSFCPVGPWIETEIDDPQNLTLEVYVGNKLRQKAKTSEMLFSVAELISFISHIMALQPGDIVSTGTPGGVGPLVHGDRVIVDISEIGTLTHRVARLA